MCYSTRLSCVYCKECSHSHVFFLLSAASNLLTQRPHKVPVSPKYCQEPVERTPRFRSQRNMPKQGGQGKGKPKLKDKDFGKALIKRQLQGAKGIDYKEKHVNMMSMLETSALEDYVASSEMAGTAVPVHRVHQYDAFLVEPSVTNTIQSISTINYDYKHLKIPRKPAWNRDMTGEEVDRREKDAFLAWRRDIAGMESANQSLKVTPFEKNIEVWRQLWRVLERSDMAIQIVDARNPLLYYTSDLMRYALEQSPPKHMILLVNKADFLTDYQRLHWAKQLTSMGIKYVFYSAFYEQEKLDTNTSSSNTVDGDEIESLAHDIVGSTNEEGDSSADKDSIYSLEESERIKSRSKVLNRDEMTLLLELIPTFLGIHPQPRHGDRVCIGMLGYPNVGKSSVINTLLGVSKSTHGVVRVGVSSTPGKTKHFQTLMVNEAVMLCDCPGLVFPSFMASTGEMLCSGILPINQMRDYVDPANVIASRVPMHLLEAAYGMHIRRELDLMDNPERPPTGHEMLSAYCAVKGYITNGTGRWDEFRACKEMLRDFNDGIILYVSVPAVVTDVNRWLLESEKVMVRREKIAERIALLRIKEAEEEAASNSISSTKKQNAAGDMESDMVFGDGRYDNDDEDASDNDDAEDENAVSRDEEEFSAATYDESLRADSEGGIESSMRREHKRLKHWGKKNRKLRDKDPYGEDNGVISYVAYTTNRSKVGGGAKSKVTRQNPLVPYGSVFIRPEFPHQVNK